MNGEIYSLAQLDTLYHQERAHFSESLRLSVHRTLSWLKKAATLDEDRDLQFICYWISFNALYGRQIDLTGDDLPLELHGSERGGFKRFLARLCNADSEHLIYDTLWVEFSQSVRLLLRNHYTYQVFWNYQRGIVSGTQLDELWQENQRLVQDALAYQNSALLCGLLFDRLYVVRNQLVHGAATYNSQVNRAQLKDGCRILSLLVPAFVQILLQHYQDFDDGEALYPVIPD